MNALKSKAVKLLRWSEKYTKTDMVYLFKGGFWLSIGQILSTILGLLLAVAFANLVSKEIYGNYKYILSIVTILSALSLTGMGTSIVQGVSKGFEGILKYSFWQNLKWGSLMIIASIIGFIYYYLNENYTLAFSLLIAGTTYPLMQSASAFGALLIGRKEFKISTIIGILKNIIPILLIFLTILITDNLIIIVTVYALSHTLTASFFYLYTIKKFKPNDKLDKNNLNFGKHLSLMNILGVVAGNIENILLFHYFGATKLAVYTFAKALPNQFTFLKKATQTLVLPKMGTKSIPELKKILPKKALKMFFVLLIIVCLYILLAPYLYKTFFPQYLDSVIYSQVLSLYILLFPSLFFNQTLIAHTKKKSLYINSTVTNVIQITALLILLPIYGIWGAIFATFIARIINFIILFISFKSLN